MAKGLEAVNVAALLEAAGRARPAKRAVYAAAEVLDWRTIDRRAGAIAAALRADGIGPGSRVALCLPDSAAILTALFGVLKAGAAAAPMNPRLTESERDRILSDLRPHRVLDRLDVDEAAFDAVAAAPEDTAIILYTSGSTGAPKGVMLSHGATDFALESWKTPVMDLGPGDVSLSALPLAHSLGVFGSALAPLIAGGTVVFLDRFTPEAALTAITEHRVTVFPAVATIFRRVLDCPDIGRYDLSSLRYALSGAAPCPWELAEEWRRVTGVRIVRGYGMTELFRPISYAAADPADVPDRIGRAVPGVDLRIVEDELWIRSPARMSGYLGRPEDTASVFEGAWFRTGDLAEIDADGFVRITGRLKDIILRGGYTVAAGEVESVLCEHPGVAEAAVKGVTHPELGEEIAAFVVPHDGTPLVAADVIAFCRERMAAYKYPRVLRIVPALPRGPTGKVMKGELVP